MPAYLVSVVEITNPTPGFKQYAEKSAQLIHKHGGRYIARGKAAGVLSGDLFQKKVLIVAEFPGVENIKAFWESDEYQKDCKPLREGSGIYDIGIFEAPPPDKA
jgi:uncharacterized protein (DUF1330 family)